MQNNYPEKIKKSTFINSPKLLVYSLLLTIAAFSIFFNHPNKVFYTYIINFSAYFFMCAVLYIITSRKWFAFSVSSLLVVIIQLLNQIKIHYYKDPLFFPDVMLMFDTANWNTLLHYPSALIAVVILIAWLVFTGFISWVAEPRKGGYKPYIFSFCIIIISTFSITFCIKHYAVSWQKSLPSGSGTPTNLIMSSQGFSYTAPDFTDTPVSYFEEKASKFLETFHGKTTKKPDIVVLLQESTVDPHFFKLPQETVLPDLGMFKTDAAAKAHTLLRVQTFGGGTWFSEFSLLTGLNSNDFGIQKSSVFYNVAPHIDSGLFREMKRNGYYTVVLTPFNKSAYHAGQAYHAFGVDKILQPQELGYPAEIEKNLWHIKTADILKYVKNILKAHTDKPLFVYALTMSEHGPYDSEHKDDFNIRSYVKNQDSAGKFSDYVSRLTSSDPALKDFISFVKNRSNRTLFLHFGDHQPSIDWGNEYNTTLPHPDYFTQFTLWDNSNMPSVSQQGEVTDISFLGGMLLEQAGLQASPFYQANIAMRHLCNGRLDDCADKTLTQSYKNYIYNKLKVASKGL